MHLEARVRRAILAAAAFVTLGVSANGVADVASADSAIPSTSSLHVAVKTPTAPRSPAATAGNAKVTLTWQAPFSNDGVGRHRAGQGTRYYVRVGAHNVAGLGRPMECTGR
jgi:hypothetical protein